MAAVDEVFEDVQSGGAMDVSDASGNGSVHGPGDGRLDAELHMEESSPRRAGDAGGTILWDGTKMALHQALDALPMERRMQQLVAGGFGLKAVDVFDERTVRRNEVAAAAAAQAEADGHDVEAAVESAIFATTPTPEDMLLGQRLGYPADHGVGTVGYFKDLSIGHTLQGEIKRMMVVELVRYSDLEHNAGGEGAAAAVEHPQRSVWVRMYNVPGHENAPQRVVFKRVTKRLAHAGRARAKGARSSDVRMGDPTVENPFLEFHVMQRLGSRYRAVCEERARVHEWVGKQAQGAAAAEAAAAVAGEDKGGEVMDDISSCNSTLSCPFRGGNGGVRSGARVAHHPNLIPLLGLYDTAPQSPLEGELIAVLPLYDGSFFDLFLDDDRRRVLDNYGNMRRDENKRPLRYGEGQSPGRLRRGLEDVLSRNFFGQLLDALEFMHSQDVCHRDINLPNVFFRYPSHERQLQIAAAYAEEKHNEVVKWEMSKVKEQPGHPKYKARVARALEAGRKARTLEMERCKREGLPAAVLLNTSTLVVADFGMCERIRRGRDASPEEVKAALVLDSRMGDAARREAAMARWREATAATAAAAASGGAGGGAGGSGGESDAATVAAVAAASAAAVAHAELHPSDEALAPFYSSYGPEEEMPVLQNTRVQKAYSQPPELRALYAAGRGYMRGARIDIYSAGVFLYVLLTGEYKLACGNQNRRILQFYRDVNASQQGFSIGDRVDRRLFQGQPVSREPSFWMSAAVELCAWACSPRDWERPTIQQMREHRWMQRSSAV